MAVAEKAVTRTVAVIVQQGKVLDFIDGATQREETPEEYVRQEIAKSLQHRIKTIIGVSTRISVLEVDGIPRTVVGKARRVIDERPKQ